MKRATLCVAILAAAFAGAVRAQDGNQTDPGVARISVLEGEASVQRGDSSEWVAAALNAPLVAGDTLSTGAGAQAEIQFDYSNMIRVASDAEVRLAQLEDQRFVLQIARGTVTFSVLRDSTAEVELNTPSISVRPLQRGSYRITVFENGESELTVRTGEAEIFGPRGTERLGPGQTMQARGSASDPEFRLVAEIGLDSWDEWNTSRDRRLEESQSYRYADRTVSGAEDLDEYGSWVNVSTYGDVWRPRVDAGWSPYYNGRWVWLDYYGWTWVSYDPWGWAPYHYGRWFWDLSFGWCWWPGGHGIRHHWSPALVAFFGYGHGGLDIGLGFGRVGWVPLGPHEPYHRWYGRDMYRAYRNGDVLGSRMGMRRDFDPRSTYMNARAQNGMVGIDAASFGRGGKMDRVRGEDVGRAGLVQGMLPVAPGRESQRMSDRDVSRGGMRSGATVGSFAGRTQVRRDERISFEEQRQSMEQGARRASGTTAGASGSAGWQGAGTRSSGETNSGGSRGIENRRETQQSTGGANSRVDAGSQNRRYEAPARTEGRPSVQSGTGRSGRISQPSAGERQGRSEGGSSGRSSTGEGGQRQGGAGGSGRSGRSR